MGGGDVEQGRRDQVHLWSLNPRFKDFRIHHQGKANLGEPPAIDCADGTVMGQHDALGMPCRAGGIHDGKVIVGIDGVAWAGVVLRELENLAVSTRGYGFAVSHADQSQVTRFSQR